MATREQIKSLSLTVLNMIVPELNPWIEARVARGLPANVVLREFQGLLVPPPAGQAHGIDTTHAPFDLRQVDDATLSAEILRRLTSRAPPTTPTSAESSDQDPRAFGTFTASALATAGFVLQGPNGPSGPQPLPFVPSTAAGTNAPLGSVTLHDTALPLSPPTE